MRDKTYKLILSTPRLSFRRPSFLPGSKSSIRISHSLEYTILFTDGDDVLKEHRASWPVVVPSVSMLSRRSRHT